MINLLMRFVYGFRMSNKVRLATFWVITGLLFWASLISGGFNQPLIDFRPKSSDFHYSEMHQIARNIDRGFGALTDAQLSKQQRSQVTQPWFSNIKYIRLILLGSALSSGLALLIVGVTRKNKAIIIAVVVLLLLVVPLVVMIFWFEWVRRHIFVHGFLFWLMVSIIYTLIVLPMNKLRDLIDRLRYRH